MVYELPRCKEVLRAFKYSGEQPPKTIKFNDLKRVCDKNLTNYLVPVKYQYPWFCLHNIQIKRKFENGREITPTVSFRAIHVDFEALNMIEQAMDKVGLQQFAKLVSVSPYTLKGWLRKEYKPQITALIKACQILNLDFWNSLEGHKLYGSGSNREFIFNRTESEELINIITWIADEGSLTIYDPRIEIKQHKNGRDALEALKDDLEKIGITNTVIKDGVDRRKNMCLLSIYSAPLRQILCLKNNIPLGYKCSTINLKTDNLSKEKKIRMLTKDIETEGCISGDYRNGFGYPRFDFCSASKHNALRVQTLWKELGYNPSNLYFPGDVYRIYIKRLKDTTKFAFEMLPYLFYKKRVKELMKVLADERILSKLKFKSARIHKLILKSLKTLPNLDQMLSKDGLKISKRMLYHWKYKETTPSLRELINICNLMSKNIFDYVPTWTSLVLFVHNKIPLSTVEEFRGESLEVLN